MNRKEIELGTLPPALRSVVLPEILAYVRISLLSPAIILYGASLVVALITLSSLVGHKLILYSLPLFGRFLPQSFSLSGDSLVYAWGVTSFVLYIITRLWEKFTKKNISISSSKKIRVLVLVLSVIYAFIIATASLRLGWFERGDTVAWTFFFLYLVTLAFTIGSWVVSIAFDRAIAHLRSS
jgi:hypothetical protein